MGWTRRSILLATAALLPACDRRMTQSAEHDRAEPDSAEPDSPMVGRARQYAQARFPDADMQRAFVQKARIVERFYTAAPLYFRYGGAVYAIPANHLEPAAAQPRFGSAFQHSGTAAAPIEADAIGGVFFWPEFGGYTRDNWFDEFDRRKIRLSRNLGRCDLSSRQQLENHLATLGPAAAPTEHVHGLRGYAIGKDEFLWVGERADGALYLMQSRHPRQWGSTPEPHPSCRVLMCDERSGEETFCTFSLALFAHWRAIDAGLVKAVAGWRIA